MLNWWKAQREAVQGVAICVGVVAALAVIKIFESDPPGEFWLLVGGLALTLLSLPTHGLLRAATIVLALACFIGGVVGIQSKDETWEMSPLTRAKLVETLTSIPSKDRYVVHFFWLKSNDQTENYLKEMLITFNNAAWHVAPDPFADITRRVAPVVVVTSNAEREARPRQAIELKKMLDEAGIMSIWGTEDRLKYGEVGIAIGKPPAWKWNDLWR